MHFQNLRLAIHWESVMNSGNGFCQNQLTNLGTDSSLLFGGLRVAIAQTLTGGVAASPVALAGEVPSFLNPLKVLTCRLAGARKCLSYIYAEVFSLIALNCKGLGPVPRPAARGDGWDAPVEAGIALAGKRKSQSKICNDWAQIAWVHHAIIVAWHACRRQAKQLMTRRCLTAGRPWNDLT